MYRLPPVSPPIGPNANGAPRSGETELRFQARRAVGVATVACGGPPATESTLKQAQKHAGAVSRVHQNARFSLRRHLRASLGHRYPSGGAPPATESTPNHARKQAGVVSRVHQNAHFSLRRTLRASLAHPKLAVGGLRRTSGHRNQVRSTPRAAGRCLARFPATAKTATFSPKFTLRGRRTSSEERESRAKHACGPPNPSRINSQTHREHWGEVPVFSQNHQLSCPTWVGSTHPSLHMKPHVHNYELSS